MGLKGDVVLTSAANRGLKSKCLTAMANIYYRNGHYEKSIEKGLGILEDTEDLKGFEEVDEIYYLLARNYIKMQQFDTALEHLHIAREINPERDLYISQIEITTALKEQDFKSGMNE